MSLQETYQSRKRLIANNLTQMGVSASENEGLTTLANKILLIESKANVNITWTLNGVSEADSVILSHKDNENAVFVFTVTDENDDPVSGYPIPLSVDGTAVSPVPTTNNQGQATYTYESQGIGDVNIDVNCGTFLTKTYELQDCSLCFANEKSQTGTTTNEIVSGFTFPNTEHWVWEYDMKMSSNNTVPCLSDENDYTHRLGIGANGASPPKITVELAFGEGAWDTSLGNFNSNTYYSFKIIRDGNYMYWHINNVLRKTTDIENGNIPISTVDNWELHWRNWGTGTTTIKNLKIKPL